MIDTRMQTVVYSRSERFIRVLPLSVYAILGENGVP